MTIDTKEPLTGGKQLPAVASPGMTTELKRVVQEGRDWLMWVEEKGRNTVKATEEIKVLCQNKAVAEKAEYALPVGGGVVKGPTIHLMKAIASKWGCIDYGWVELYQTELETCGRVYARDLITKASSSETVVVKHMRYANKQFQPIKDPDSIYRHVMQRVSKRLRECLKNVIPANVVDEALTHCKNTLQSGSDLQVTLTKMLKAFNDDFKIEPTKLGAYLRKDVSTFDLDDIDTLRTIHRSLREGDATIEEIFGAAEEVVEAEVTQEAPKQPEPVAPPAEVSTSGTAPDPSGVPDAGGSSDPKSHGSAGQDPPTDSTSSEPAEVKTSAPAKKAKKAKESAESVEASEPDSPATQAIKESIAQPTQPEDVF